ncbi:MAG: hypothetical protein AAF399_17860, partial [Bacteroidota bacterium]
MPLNQGQVKELYQQFRYHFWEEAKEEHTNQKEFVGVASRQQFALPSPRQVLLTQQASEKQALRDQLLAAVQSAEQS